EASARVRSDLDLFASLGYVHARFGRGVQSSGVDVSGNKVPSTPDYTASLGARYSRPLNPRIAVYARGEGVFYGAFRYNDANTQGQSDYALANLAAGL